MIIFGELYRWLNSFFCFSICDILLTLSYGLNDGSSASVGLLNTENRLDIPDYVEILFVETNLTNKVFIVVC